MLNEHCQETSDDDFESVSRSGTACLTLSMYATVQEIPTCEMRVFHDRTAASAHDCTISLMIDWKGSEDISDPILAVTNSLSYRWLCQVQATKPNFPAEQHETSYQFIANVGKITRCK